MSKKVCVVLSSVGSESQSSAIAHQYVEALKVRGVEVSVLDVGRENPAHLDGGVIAEFFGGDGGAGAKAQLQKSNEWIGVLKDSDALIIAAPMYNFTIPSQLKVWIDHVARVGHTFHYTETGPVGLLKGKRALVISSSGGVYSKGPAAGLEHVQSYLGGVLGFLGYNVLPGVFVEGLAMGQESRDSALAGAKEGIEGNVLKLLA